MDQPDSKSARPRVKRRRRGPTRPNVYVTIFGAMPQTEAAPVPELEREHPAESEEVLVSTEWLERRSKRLDAFEQELRQRQIELDRREAELEDKEARREANLYLREDELDRREERLAELEQRLGQRESEIGSYVARLQGGFLRAG